MRSLSSAFATIFLLTATAVTPATLLMADAARAQGATRDSCASLCDCNNLQCTDFCSPSQCGRSACKRQFEALVRECQKACNSCMRLQRSKKS